MGERNFHSPSGTNFNHATIVVGSTLARREDHGSRPEYEQAPGHPRCLDEATKGDRFWAYVTDSLSPVLKPGDTMILDDYGAQKEVGKRDSIQTAGVQLLLRFTALFPGDHTSTLNRFDHAIVI
ncbi:hypothetical protein Y590_16393 [Methylobacterium sp. AMS5]|nr:hypothetical protein Y590_16393 [Methylobacterium sp. AMS5]